MKAKVSGIELYYEEQGAGFPIILTHGIGGSADNWSGVVPPLAERYRVITWDVRGFARSAKPPGPYSASLWASDLAGLMDALGIAQAHILGHSMGGVIAQRFALDFPEKVATLILVSTSSQVNEKASERWLAQADTIEREGFEAYTLAQQKGYTAEFLKAHPDQLENDRRRIEMNETHAYAAAARAVASYNFTAELAQITAPALILQGANDPQTPPGGSVIISRQIPGSRLVILENTGHGIYTERPHRFVALANEFLDHVQRLQRQRSEMEQAHAD